MKRMRNLKGFTLIELIVVILILGILAAIAVVGYSSVTEKAQDAARDANAKQIVTALSADTTLSEAGTVAAFLDSLEGTTNDTEEAADLGAPYATTTAYLAHFNVDGGLTYDATADTVTIGTGGSAVVLDVSGAVASVTP